jgi:hypothetical protein
LEPVANDDGNENDILNEYLCFQNFDIADVHVIFIKTWIQGNTKKKDKIIRRIIITFILQNLQHNGFLAGCQVQKTGNWNFFFY